MILWKQTLEPKLERFTPSTNLNPNLQFDKLPTPTYTMGLKKSSTPHHQGGEGGLKLWWMSQFQSKTNEKQEFSKNLRTVLHSP